MIEPAISPVAPRVFSPESGAVLQLTDEVELLLASSDANIKVRLDGEGNVGALSHLRAVFADQVTSGQLRLESKTLLSLDQADPLVTICTDPSFLFLFPTGKQIHDGEFDIVLRLAPWGRDDFIEYLLAKHPKQCASVMARLEHADVGYAGGSPVLWAMVLDRMAGNESKTDVETIVLEEIDLRINNPALSAAVADRLIFPTEPDRIGVLGHSTNGSSADENVFTGDAYSAAAEFLSHERVKFAFAIKRIAQRLRDGDNSEVRLLLQHRIRTMALVRLASEIVGDTQTHAKLALLFKRNRRWEATNSATLLALSDPNWRPRGKTLNLYEACFDEVVWPDVNLQDADLRQATLAGADLSGADLRGCKLSGANFSRAKLIGADFYNSERFSLPPNTQVVIAAPAASEDELADEPVKPKKGPLSTIKQRMKKMRHRKKRRKRDKGVDDAVQKHRDAMDAIIRLERVGMGAINQFQRVNFRSSDLSRANLSGCLFHETDFRGALLSEALVSESIFINTNMDDVDLVGADFSRSAFQSVSLSRVAIDGCRFCRARFSKVSFEDIEAGKVDFSKAALGASTWSGSKLTECSFYDAGLSGGRMAEIRWEFCDLREADLRGCTFHMGSTRSGIVNSPYPSHGTRTGFYTDDYNDQHFQAPELIRKACLYGCDLRGANIHGVDFYLVDLRAGKFDDSQREQLISTGAILDDDVI